MKIVRWGCGVLVVLALAGCYKTGEKVDSPKPVAGSAWHELAIGERLAVSGWSVVLRVPGGWVFSQEGAYSNAVCFIPYSSEGK